MENPTDTLHFGRMVQSFRGYLVNGVVGDAALSVFPAIMVRLDTSDLVSWKFVASDFAIFHRKLRQTMNNLPSGIDVRDTLENSWRSAKSGTVEHTQLSAHPVIMRLATMIDDHELDAKIDASQFVELISLDYWTDLSKLDVSFKSGTAERFTLASSLIPVLAECVADLSNALSEGDN
ncbi:MAG: hypothetical protein AAGC76_04965 [Luteibacter sp.]|uniref:hypothetical protein n=1 Tax=Luteibacter sp. TaxID=1886636 RepID=UPI0028067E22|nr:hypothetical protein [Luteibacter sp.]MDQ7995187.1 hypothetical protein [Luteibacter sp.]